ncbi:MAG: hypothetical protein U0V75_09845 [Ferruginibacter sp.]
MAGYSGTPLIKKLGITDTTGLLLLNAPADYSAMLDMDYRSLLVNEKTSPDIVHLFAADAAAFLKGMKTILPLFGKNNKMVLWVSWYKKTAGIKTDITEDTIRDFALKQGLVDVKVCAVNDIWSGLKLVVPLAKRK